MMMLMEHVRKFKVDPNQKPSIVNGNSSVEDTSTHDQYAPLFPSMKLIVDGYASLNENLGDLSLFNDQVIKISGM